MSASSFTLTPERCEALGLEADADLPSALQALGVAQTPEHFLQVLARYPEDLKPPRRPRWTTASTAPESLAIDALSRPVWEQIRQLQRELHTAQMGDNWTERLHALQGQYPDIPGLFHLEVIAARQSGDRARWQAQAEQVNQRFPHYVFTVCSLATCYLLENQPEQVRALLVGRFDLHDYTSQERVFEWSEVTSFYAMISWYHLVRHRFIHAVYAYALVQEASPREPQLDLLGRLLLSLPAETLFYLRRTLTAV